MILEVLKTSKCWKLSASNREDERTETFKGLHLTFDAAIRCTAVAHTRTHHSLQPPLAAGISPGVMPLWVLLTCTSDTHLAYRACKL
jgi:hypothetical protein